MGIMMIAGTERRHQGCSLQDGKQWGYIESLSGTRDLNLPLAYVNRHLCVVATGGNTKGYGAIRAQTISLTQVRLYAYTSEDGAYSHYLSLGYQLQWGFCGAGTINLPISFVEQIFICIVTDMTSSVNNSDGYFSWNPDKSAISSILITSSSGAGGGNYIVIGF